MEENINKYITEISEKFNSELDQALINACIKKGFVLNIASATGFMTVEHDGWKLLVHIPTQTKICKYSTSPRVTMGYDNKDFVNDKYTIRCDIDFQEL